MNEPLIFHIDVNSAFLSWESVYRLKELGETNDLRLIPSAIGGDQETRHGIILAKSTPAKQFNIQTGEPIVHALKKCPTLTIVPVRFDIYHKYSKAFMNILREYTPLVEKFSIDEAFMDLTNTIDSKEDPVVLATTIKDRIYHELGFTVNVGISNNKLLAKMAGDFKKPNLVHTLFPEEIPKKMWPLDVRDLLFVGKATYDKLNLLGIRTIGDLAHFDLKILNSHFGKNGTMLYEYANGIDHSIVKTSKPDPKGYSNSITLSHDTTDSKEAKKILLSLCESLGTRLREDNVLALVVCVSLTDCNFHNQSHQISLSSATNTTNEIYKHVCNLFDELWDKKTPIRLLGVHVSKLTKEAYQQYSIFDYEQPKSPNKLDQALDEIRKKYGADSVIRASLLSKESKYQ